MTPVDKDDFEDAELSRRLAALPQPEPSAELDAAIFAQIQKDLAPGPAAANDPAVEAPPPKIKHRYRAPLAFAASLAGIAILLPVWRSYQHQHLREEIQPVETKIVEAERPASPPMQAATDADTAHPADKKREAPVVAAKPSLPAPVAEMPIQASEPAAAAAPPPPPPMSTPAPAAAPPAPKMEVDELDPPRKAAARVQDPVSPKEWLQSIERTLDAGDAESAAAQWKRFRITHPDYPVPDILAGRLKALE